MSKHGSVLDLSRGCGNIEVMKLAPAQELNLRKFFFCHLIHQNPWAASESAAILRLRLRNSKSFAESRIEEKVGAPYNAANN